MYDKLIKKKKFNLAFAAVTIGAAVLTAFTIKAGLVGWAISKLSSEGICDIIYRNPHYGFLFNLPSSWKGYRIVTDKWEGHNLDGSRAEAGSIIIIRSPLWIFQNPRQDIPVMVLTLNQWRKLQNDEFSIGAAPIMPTELGRNSDYVFALPARYNFAFLPGFEEVEEILENKPLQAF